MINLSLQSTGQFFNCKSKPRPLSTTMIPPSNTTEIDQDTEEGDSDNLLMYIFIVVGIIVLLFIAGAAFCFLKMRSKFNYILTYLIINFNLYRRC